MQPELSILIPVFNEDRTLSRLMQDVSTECPDAQIIYVDDGSIDQSFMILKTYKRPGDIVLQKGNGGKGSAIREGLPYAKGTYTVIQDADLEYHPSQINLLLEEAKKNPGCAVFGSRFLTPNPNIYKRYLWGNKFLTFCLDLLFGIRITDSYTCYKLLPTDVFQSLKLNSNGFEIEMEICAACARRGIPIREVPIVYHPRSLEEGKKIGWRDALTGLWTLLRLRCWGA